LKTRHSGMAGFPRLVVGTVGPTPASVSAGVSGRGWLCQGAAHGDAGGRVPIAEFVALLRAELKEAQATRDPGLQFAVGTVQVEFTVVTGREGGPEGRVRFWVVEAGGSAKWSQSETQKVLLSLTPVDENGDPIFISDRVPGPPP
jgi:hypothetical protein